MLQCKINSAAIKGSLGLLNQEWKQGTGCHYLIKTYTIILLSSNDERCWEHVFRFEGNGIPAPTIIYTTSLIEVMPSRSSMISSFTVFMSAEYEFMSPQYECISTGYVIGSWQYAIGFASSTIIYQSSLLLQLPGNAFELQDINRCRQNLCRTLFSYEIAYMYLLKTGEKGRGNEINPYYLF